MEGRRGGEDQSDNVQCCDSAGVAGECQSCSRRALTEDADEARRGKKGERWDVSARQLIFFTSSDAAF